MMLGFLLARAGVEVAVLEKHADFLRDFRGDTIHPSTLEIMYELGLLEEFLRRPHQELTRAGGQIGDHSVTIADFSHLPTHSRFLAFMPQREFLNFLAEQGKRYKTFHLHMQSEVTGLIEERGRVVGVRATAPNGPMEIIADLVVGADGRHSTVRQQAGLEVINRGAPIDVLWMRLSREPGDSNQTLGRIKAGKILVTLDRGDYWQCAYVIPKGEFAAIQSAGMPTFRQQIAEVAPELAGRVNDLKDWSDIKLLTVVVDHLRHWSKPGLLCIGDSAHAMSPVGGVGINLAVQDAVAAANILWRSLFRGTLRDEELQAVQKRREFPTRMTQKLQVFAHRRLIFPTLKNQRGIRALPLPFKLLQMFPVLQRLPARMIGMGFRPEHVHSPVSLDIAV